MKTVGWHASHELYPPGKLIRLARRAEGAGFRAAMCSDHFHPWTPQQGESGFAFSWLGAALQATRLPFGSVCCPFGRYHPAVVAQAAGTLAEMYPGRYWLALGTGQALNESITGGAWPAKPERRAYLREAVDVIRALWSGETVTHRGLVRVEGARLYTRPAAPPLLFGAALTAETAEWVGSWADGLLTVGHEPDRRRAVVDAFHRGGGEGKPMALQAAVGYAPDEGEAWGDARARWPVAGLGQDLLQDCPAPERIAAAAAAVRAEDLRGKLRVSSDPGRHVDWIRGDFAAGFGAVYLHFIGRGPDRFIDAFAEKVLPAC
ncbi:-methylene tetrahydromethanopterin reductase : F420-dependent oxidoreductase, G6PDH family OS=Crinalium epipsammum PCC 9333 GN=Cri9333_4069 PE=4 SV=1: Bac_luciferase [Gemmata massiliana]|uniref:Luciferase-like domain-containing protein n=1 Tax=Gemmata massiliana TaxID=1210884 RepID=A0A6P2DJY6_9BACT|nr:TIGR03885 family FMN-dependent LLM class oxidoreductase [Gemmata massiliana]VTS00668.1 -methylene tetrahydromethanopterin reductase : F420-dependent oxidoreductase, G6PDH family OS=Crinalium epipsammum PCC 9333 GN=Cri9333_4069 PE=4 SV=1: Bac_luciferase [Gemmata massiliana]